jgi:hypothetical protein
MMGAVSSSETPVSIYQARWCNNPEGSHLLPTTDVYTGSKCNVGVCSSHLQVVSHKTAFLKTVQHSTSKAEHTSISKIIKFLLFIAIFPVPVVEITGRNFYERGDEISRRFFEASLDISVHFFTFCGTKKRDCLKRTKYIKIFATFREMVVSKPTH